MAMQDLGLVYNEERNGIQMRDFINKAYLKNDKLIKDQKTLTDWTGKLLGSMFGAMDEHHLLGNYSREDFEKMKDCYWLCLSIINKVVQLDLLELQFAPYLYEEHESRSESPNRFLHWFYPASSFFRCSQECAVSGGRTKTCIDIILTFAS